MLKTSPEGLKDFQTCGLLYDFRHNQKLPEAILGRNIVTEKFENTLKSVINFFLYKKQSGFAPSYAALLNRWEKLWFPKDASAQDIINDKHESAYGNMSSLTTKAASILLSFYEYFSDPDIIPIGISEEYNLPINNVLLVDNFDLIYMKNNRVHVIKWVFNYKSNHSYLYHIDFASMYWAYHKKKDGVTGSAVYGFYDIVSNKPTVEILNIGKEDIDALHFWVDELSSSRNLVPRRGLTYYCKRCPFDTPCSKWSNWIKE